MGGSRDTFPTTIFTDRACWQQSTEETVAQDIDEFDKRGIRFSDRVYFTTRPDLDERDILEVTNGKTGQTNTYEVIGLEDPDASAGLGVLYKVRCRRTTTGSTSER